MSDERYVDAPPAGPEEWRQVWEEERRYRPRASRHEWFLRAARRLTRRALEPDSERQKNFNVALLELVADLRRHVETVRDELRRDIAAVQIDMRMADEALAAEVARLRDLIPVAVQRNDALIAALDQKIETIAVRVRDLATPLLQSTAPVRSDFLYRRLEDGLRGSEAEIRQALEPYAELATDHQPVIDAGCGRGEFLLMCRQRGIEARGFDTNERSVSDLKHRGLDVELARIPECFASTQDGSVGSILASHIVEHLPVDALFDLFRESARVLRRGGLLMIETPNAESLLVSASEFWRDPTHLAPRHPAALTLLAREHGFRVHEIRAVHPLPQGASIAISNDDPPELQRVIRAINERLFGPQDLRLVLRKE